MIKVLQGIWFSIQNANGNSSLNSSYLKITSCSASVTHIPHVYLPYCQSSLWQSERLQEEDPTPPHTKQQNCLQSTPIFSASVWLMIMLMAKIDNLGLAWRNLKQTSLQVQTGVTVRSQVHLSSQSPRLLLTAFVPVLSLFSPPLGREGKRNSTVLRCLRALYSTNSFNVG